MHTLVSAITIFSLPLLLSTCSSLTRFSPQSHVRTCVRIRATRIDLAGDVDATLGGVACAVQLIVYYLVVVVVEAQTAFHPPLTMDCG